jgi:hypothetical protein
MNKSSYFELLATLKGFEDSKRGADGAGLGCGGGGLI